MKCQYFTQHFSMRSLVFFYGKYKVDIKVKTKKDKLLGCVSSEANVLRLWEIPL